MTDLEQLIEDIVREMYEEANPGLDLDDVKSELSDMPDDWYDRHFLPKERQREILDKHLEEADLTDREETSVHTTVILGYAPRQTPVRKEDEKEC